MQLLTDVIVGYTAAKYSEAAPSAPEAKRESQLLGQALDQYRDPLLIISAERRLLFQNTVSQKVLGARTGVADKGGRLVLGSAHADDALDRLIAQEARLGAAHTRMRGIRVTRSGATRDWLLLVQRLRSTGAREPLFLIQIIGRTKPRSAPMLVLRDLFDLSRRETTVLSELLRDDSIQAAADRLSLSVETIRSHLKRIFRKCNVHSRTELIALLQCISQFGG